MLPAAPETRPGTHVLVPSGLMGSRLSILAGLLAGLLVAGALLLGFVFIGPDPARPPASPSNSPAASSAAASPVGSAAASGSAAAPGSGAPGSPGSSAGVVVTP